MEEIATAIFDFIFVSVESFFAEYTIMFLLVGVACLLLGAFIISYQLYKSIKGQKVDGTIVGAVKDVKITIEDGKVIKKRLNYGTLFPIFEYRDADGTIRQDRGSTGGTHVYKYKTGQKIKLVILPKGKYNHVSDAQSYIEYVLGVIVVAIGAGIIYSYLSLYSSFNLSTFVWLGIIVSLALKFKDKISNLIKEYRENKEKRNKVFILEKEFDPNYVRPIEAFIEEREQNRKKHRS